MKTQRKKGAPAVQPHDSLAYDLRLALMTQQLQLVFQPKVCIQTQQIVGAEVLLRWQHPVEGLISADRWVSLAETHNLMRPLTLWLLDKVVQYLENANDSAIPLAINVSPNILDGAFAIHILKTLSAAGIAPHLLEIEITESTPVSNMTNLANALHLLQSRGVKIYLDDFGTGYSTMQYLVDVPADGIKIDKRFVQQAPLLPAARLILRSLIELANEIGVTVVCEGVETIEQLTLVKRLGAQIIQGYISGKPMSSDAFTNMIEAPSVSALPDTQLSLYKVQAS
ncbi:MAG: EAL domain-containing protein [Alphaproteobacteria bacterium]|nr:EAL domain-containing protein [Alphaproteobacteria bacterium]